MARRRKNQPDLKSLSLLARFLNHVCEQEGFTQAQLAKEVGASTATLSRWFRDTIPPTDEDLKTVAKVTGVPVENFYALRMLDNLGTDKAMGSTSAVAQFLTEGSKSFIMLNGLTMLAGVTQFRASNISNKSILLNTVDPRIEKFASKSLNNRAFETRASWLAMASILNSINTNQKNLNIRLWIRENLEIMSEPLIKELAASDYIAFKSSDNVHEGKSYSVHFYNDKFWNDYIDPLLARLQSSESNESRSLIWDSTKSITINKKFLQQVVDLLDPELTKTYK